MKNDNEKYESLCCIKRSSESMTSVCVVLKVYDVDGRLMNGMTVFL